MEPILCKTVDCQIGTIQAQMNTLHQMMTNHLQHHQVLEVGLVLALVGFILNAVRDNMTGRKGR